MKSDSLQGFSEYLQTLCVIVPYTHSSVIITQCACIFRLLKICSFFNFKIITDEDMRHIETSISNKNISIVMWSILNPDYHLENHIYFTLPSQWSFLVETFPSIPLHFAQLWNYNANNQTAKITTTSCRLILDSIFCRKMKSLSILLSCLLTNALMNV